MIQLGMAVALFAASAVQPAAPPTWQDLENWTYAYADKYGANAADLLRIANCESPRHDPYAIGRLGEVGGYQLHPRGVWLGTPQARAGYSIYDVEAQVAAAAWIYAQGWAYTTLGWYWCSRNG